MGSPFGSGDVKKTNQAGNEKRDSADVVDPALATVLGFAADAKLTGDALSELTKNLDSMFACKLFQLDNIELDSNKTITPEIDVKVDGYTPIGATSWQVAGATNNGSGPAMCNVYGIVISNDKIIPKLANLHASSTIRIRFIVIVLYIKNTLNVL